MVTSKRGRVQRAAELCITRGTRTTRETLFPHYSFLWINGQESSHTFNFFLDFTQLCSKIQPDFQFQVLSPASSLP